MVELFRCRICGDPYIGEVKPSRCPFCGAYPKYIIEASDYDETFDVELTGIDEANARKALDVEVSNAAFYFCAAGKVTDNKGRQMFKALGKVEAEHASIWRKILKLPKDDIKPSDKCFEDYSGNLKESHEREDRAIKFYSKAANESSNIRVKQIFHALAEVETDHLRLGEDRLR